MSSGSHCQVFGLSYTDTERRPCFLQTGIPQSWCLSCVMGHIARSPFNVNMYHQWCCRAGASIKLRNGQSYVALSYQAVWFSVYTQGSSLKHPKLVIVLTVSSQCVANLTVFSDSSPTVLSNAASINCPPGGNRRSQSPPALKFGETNTHIDQPVNTCLGHAWVSIRCQANFSTNTDVIGVNVGENKIPTFSVSKMHLILSKCVNSLRPSASVNLPSLVQIMACRLAGAKPLSEPILRYC